MKKLNKISFLVCAMGLGFGQVKAQLNPNSSNFMFNPIAVNPAMSGLHTNQVQVGFEAQWLGLEGAPKTGYLRYDKLFNENSGWNFAIISDHIGPISSITISNAFGYHFKTTEKTFASLGLRHNLSQHYLSLSSQKINDVNDPLLAGDLTSVPVNNFDAGATFYNPESFLVGFSYRNIIPQRRFRGNEVTEVPVISLHGWYTREINSDISLEAIGQFNTSPHTPINSQFAVMGVYQQMFGGGLNFSPKNQLGIFAYIKTKDKINFFYNYNLPISDIFQVSKQSHAIGISYRFGKDQNLYNTFFIQPTDGASGNRLF
ncbi:MAG: PorP/SprF family type IX secretion system membrane protein [Bacteroidia bacterium]